MIVKEVSYEITDPTIDSQAVSLQSAGCDMRADGGDAEVRRPDDPQDGGHELEAAAHHDQRLDLGRRGDQAGRAAERAWA